MEQQPSDSSRDDLPLLLATLPPEYQRWLEEGTEQPLLEIVMDLGRRPAARYLGGARRLLERSVTREDLDAVLGRVGEFTADNRSGIERTLHRISALRNRQGVVVGLTLRVGRAVRGCGELIGDLLSSGRSVLLVGRPGVGKTTILREAARVLADELGKWVMIVDTSNEIAGDGDIPHPGIGTARRLQVPHPNRQHGIMIEAVENHGPDVIIVDEIGTEAEADAAHTIAERGVQLIATAHGNSLENLVLNPTLSDLVGGVQAVTLGDEEARFRGTQKTVSERKGPPTFDIVVEMMTYHEVVVHRDTAVAVDLLLRGLDPGGEVRLRSVDGRIEVEKEPPRAEPAPYPEVGAQEGPTRIYAYALSRDSVERVIRDLHLEARVVSAPEYAQVIIALRSRAGDNRLQRLVQETGASLHFVKRNSTAQVRRLLQGLFHVLGGVDEEEVTEAVREAQESVQKVLREGTPVELAPRRPSVRKLQHQVITRYGLLAESVGKEPARHIVIRPD